MIRFKSYGHYTFSPADASLLNSWQAKVKRASSLGKFKSVLKSHILKISLIEKYC